MGGPWRDCRFDPATWRAPVARVEARAAAAGSGGSDPLTGIVIGYIASVLMSMGFLLILLKNGW
jgi:hypothetical protein